MRVGAKAVESLESQDSELRLVELKGEVLRVRVVVDEGEDGVERVCEEPDSREDRTSAVFHLLRP